MEIDDIFNTFSVESKICSTDALSDISEEEAKEIFEDMQADAYFSSPEYNDRGLGDF